MSRPLIIGLLSEGPTDRRFLPSIITRTIEDIVYNESDDLSDIYDIQLIDGDGASFTEKILNAAIFAHSIGVMILCVHSDADNKYDDDAYNFRITPAFNNVMQFTGEACKILVPIVPIRMVEAWMHADIDLLKREISTTKSNSDLGFIKSAQSYSDPKNVIENAIRVSQEGIGKRRKRYEITISDLYQPIGQKVSLGSLAQIPSYTKFRNNMRSALFSNFLIHQST